MGTQTVTVKAEDGSTATYTVQLPPRPAARPRVGTIYPGRNRAAWNIVRTFNQANALTVLHGGSVVTRALRRLTGRAVTSAAALGTTVATSYTSYLGGPGWSLIAAKVSGVRGLLAALPDDGRTIYVCPTHEPEDQYLAANGGNAVAAGAQSKADDAVFVAQVRAVNATRTTPLIPFQCFMSFSLLDGQASRKIDGWVLPDRDVVMGIDVYGDTTRVDKAVAFAKKWGKALAIPEMGPAKDTAPLDGPIEAYIRYGVAAAARVELDFLTWWDDAPRGNLDAYPGALAYLISQIAA